MSLSSPQHVDLIPASWSRHTPSPNAPDAILEACQDLFGQIDLATGQTIAPCFARQPTPANLAALQRLVTDSTFDALIQQLHGEIRMMGHNSLRAGRTPALLGGDHAVALGLIEAVAQAHPGMGILHISADLALRTAVGGIRRSGASLMANALQHQTIARVVHVGGRQAVAEEVDRARNDPRYHAFYDHEIGERLLEGHPWSRTCAAIVAVLPPRVYVSFSVRGLAASLRPNGPPTTPGGLRWHQLTALLSLLAQKRRVIGFDLCDVAPKKGSAWDARVGAEVLIRLSGCALRSGTDAG